MPTVTTNDLSCLAKDLGHLYFDDNCSYWAKTFTLRPVCKNAKDYSRAGRMLNYLV